MNSLFRACLVLSVLLVAGSALAGGGVSLVGSFLAREKLQEKVVCPSGVCGKQYSGSFQITYTAGPYTSETVDAIDSHTTLTLAVGDFSFVELIGNDPNFHDGDTKASLLSIVKLPSGSATAVRVKLSWAKGKVRIKLKGLTPFATSPIAADAIGSAPGTLSPTANMSFDLLNQTGGFGYLAVAAPFTGTLTRKTQTVDSVDYQLDKIKLAGGLNPLN